MSDSKNYKYREEQLARQIWLWIFIFSICLPMWYATYRQFVVDSPLGNQPPSDTVMVIFWVVFGMCMPVLAYTAKLQVEIEEEKISVRYFPFHVKWRHFEKQNIKNVYLREYNPLIEYGGWGIRIGFSGWAYTIGGNTGLQINLKSGKPVLVGIKNPTEANRALIEAGFGTREESV